MSPNTKREGLYNMSPNTKREGQLEFKNVVLGMVKLSN